MAPERPSKKNALASPRFSEVRAGGGETQGFPHVQLCRFEGGAQPARQSTRSDEGAFSHGQSHSDSHVSHPWPVVSPLLSPQARPSFTAAWPVVDFSGGENDTETTWGGGGRRRRSRGGGAQGSRREGRGRGRGGPRAGGQNASRRPGLVPSLQSRPEVSSNNTEPEASSVHTQCVESVTQRCGSEQAPGTVEQGRHPVGREENFHSVGAVSFCFPAP